MVTTKDSTEHRLLLAGDSHGNVRWLSHVCRYAVDLGIARVLQLGDFGIWPGRGGEEFLAELSDTAEGLGVRVDFIDGNHDDHSQLANLHARDYCRGRDGSYQVHNAIHWWPRGSVAELGGRRVGFLGGAVSVDRDRRVPGRSWWEDEEVTGNDVDVLLGACGDEPLDILFTHDCPDGVAYPLRGFAGLPRDVVADANRNRRLLAEAVEYTQPRMVFHGHWHRRYRSTITVGDHTCGVWGLANEAEDGLAVVELAALEVDDLGVPFPT